ncbi:PEP-CTERM sorting domain-containing protein [Spartinivicinus ruber]|uniref:PEP-CTERM sorting domain-containing protein n=1 Tax=Spartinivicinus ruber TaxID=2683272 RepID=UPI0013D7F53D|nr:PEP-CTERM sorting domain-containing protein [Spartinivicinus ruber]
MKKLVTLLGSSALVLSSQLFALPFNADKNITVYDGKHSRASGWYGPQEDNEIEPGNLTGQKWDLEGFFQKENTLSLIGGFNYQQGATGYHNRRWHSGDIFIDIDNNHINANSRRNYNGNDTVQNTFGYDYVFDVDWANLTYDIIKLDNLSSTKTAYYGNNYGSSAWLYAGGGQTIGNGTFSISTLTDQESGFSGGIHYGATGFDLSFLGENRDFYAHFTMQCGNDNLKGHGKTPNKPVVPVPVPSTIALIGLALLGANRFNKRS